MLPCPLTTPQHNVLDKKRDRETQEEEELYEQVFTLSQWSVGGRGGKRGSVLSFVL